MTFSSIKEVKENFNIDNDNLDSIRDILNKMRSELHPDKSNGNFKSTTEKEKYYRLNNAIDYVDKVKSNSSLAVIETVTELIKKVTDIIPINKDNILNQNLENKISDSIQERNFKLKFPKITLTGISTIFTFLIAFPNQMKDNPFLSKYIDPNNPAFIIIWVFLIVYTGIFWLFAYTSEDRSKKRITRLKMGSEQNKLFNDFIFETHLQRFTKDNFTNFIYENNKSHGGIFSLYGNIFNLEIAQGIAEIIIFRALNKGVINKIDNDSLEEEYLIKKIIKK
jgi:hypothetical protein